MVPQKRFFFTALASLGLVSCAAGPNYRPATASELALPQAYSDTHGAVLDEAELASWWKRFNDPALDGSEAVENAVKIARAATGRPAVVTFGHAYHGRTLLTMTMTAKNAPYKDGFGPFAPEVYRAPLAYPYRWDSGPERCAAEALAALEDLARQGLVEVGGTGIQVTADGWFFVRAVAMVFDRYLQSDRNRARFSRII